VSPIRGLLAKAAKGARHVVRRLANNNPWLLPGGAIIVVALADIGFGKAGAFLALGAIALALVGFGAGLLSSGSPREAVDHAAASPRPAGKAHGAVDDGGADGAGSTVADTSAGSGTNASEHTLPAAHGDPDDVTAGTRTDLSFARLTRAKLTGADLRGADLRCAVLRGADLRGARLNGVNLEGADLTGARLTPLEDDSAPRD
jgi:hypothetical protein